MDGFPVLIGAAAAQQPNWPDPGPAAESMQILRGWSAPVEESECAALKAALAAVRCKLDQFDAVNDVSPDPVARIPDPRRLVAAYDNAARTLAEIRQSWASDGRHGHFCTSTHFGWLGDRIRNPDMAHIALAESVSNSIGVKLGPSVTPAQAAELSRRLNPGGEPGRLTLTVRMGAGLNRPIAAAGD